MRISICKTGKLSQRIPCRSVRCGDRREVWTNGENFRGCRRRSGPQLVEGRSGCWKGEEKKGGDPGRKSDGCFLPRERSTTTKPMYYAISRVIGLTRTKLMHFRAINFSTRAERDAANHPDFKSRSKSGRAINLLFFR